MRYSLSIKPHFKQHAFCLFSLKNSTSFIIYYIYYIYNIYIIYISYTYYIYDILHKLYIYYIYYIFLDFFAGINILLLSFIFIFFMSDISFV